MPQKANGLYSIPGDDNNNNTCFYYLVIHSRNKVHQIKCEQQMERASK